jgi:undecaprenyl-phosphate 4-deoxy-4-formamido-L-arabinose transferase
MDYSIVVPVYRGENCVEPLLERIKNFFATVDYTYEVVFVYDCGPDNSWPVLLKLKEENKEFVKLIKLSRNFGQHNALVCGFQYAQGDFIVTLDEDLQQDPFDLPKLIAKQKEGDYDLVYGKFEELHHSFFRRFTSNLFKKIISKGIPSLNTDYTAYRLIKSKIAKSVIEMRNSYTFIDGYFSWITTNVGSCEVSHHDRYAGVSSYTFSKLIEHSINIFVTFSNYPIRLLTKFSIVLFILNIFYGIYLVVRKLVWNDLAMGYPSLLLIITFGISLIMLAIGIVGEYIYRINMKTTKRPNYNIDKVL